MEPGQTHEFLVLDGPTGTQLIARGFQAHPVLWTARAAVERPDLLRAIHLDYLAAGANIITANTFRTSSYTAEKAGLSAAEARRLTHAALAVATEAIEDGGAGARRFLAGSLAPLEDCYHPAATPELAVLEKVHAETSGWLVEGGVDMVLAETMGTVREALVAVRAARKAGATVAVSFIPDESGARLLGGDGLLEAATLCVQSGAESVLVNCAAASVLELALETLQPLARDGVPLGAYANAAHMHVEFGGGIRWEEDARPENVRVAEYAERVAGWRARFGVKIAGGCCGMSPAFIRGISGGR